MDQPQFVAEVFGIYGNSGGTILNSLGDKYCVLRVVEGEGQGS